MPNYPNPSDAPFDLEPGRVRFLYSHGHQVPIVARSRRRVIVEAFGQRHHLNRRRLERDGIDVDAGRIFTVTIYPLQELTA